jgi:hypothetical protein
MQNVTLEYMAGKDRRLSYGRKSEEYVADFVAVSRRHLSPAEHQLFRFHFLLGADWRMCCKRLNLDRGAFFHAVYRIEQKLGRVYRELEPYGLFPLDEYFYAVGRDVRPKMNLDDMLTRESRPVNPRIAEKKAA